MEWFVNNLGTIVVALVLVGMVTLAVRVMVRDRKQGKTCSCGSCSGDGCCHCGEKNTL